ncbi:glutaredoxin family protein [Fictibacillus nanhaiensis]|uniref:glutaredoxin family protein n=1 Tax=Fictibacillus nanhaiensis TaxID=742169 RepID=UPI002E1ED705|nr:glutaredoxin family protein [Fictibacillus nanhaiensis]
MEITIYMNDNCGYCHDQKKWMNELNIQYQEKDIRNDQNAHTEFLNLKGLGTPLTIIKNGNEVSQILGFNQAQLKKILGIK